MKKLIKGALFLALVGTIMVGCEKEDSVNPVDSTELNVSKSKSDNNKSINTIEFSEGSYELSSDWLSLLEFNSVTVAEGNYVIEYGEGNYGSTTLNLTSVSGGNGSQNTAKGGVSIYSRKKKCLYGIGLRCGFFGVAAPSLDRTFEADVTVDPINNTLSVTFLEYVDWSLMNN